MCMAKNNEIKFKKKKVKILINFSSPGNLNK